MLKEDKNKILLKLDEMESYIEDINNILPDEKEYLSSLIKRRACEKTIELAIKSLIDACSMIISAQKLGVPSDEDNIFDILANKKVISSRFRKRLKEMKSFRNIIVHKYGDVDDKLAYETISSDLGDFETFKKEILDYLKNS